MNEFDLNNPDKTSPDITITRSSEVNHQTSSEIHLSSISSILIVFVIIYLSVAYNNPSKKGSHCIQESDCEYDWFKIKVTSSWPKLLAATELVCEEKTQSCQTRCAQSSDCDQNQVCDQISHTCFSPHLVISKEDRASKNCIDECKTQGRCHYENFRCVASFDSMCREADICKLEGKCFLKDSRCIAKEDEDCRLSKACEDKGKCSVGQDECIAISDSDCQQKWRCSDGQCEDLKECHLWGEGCQDKDKDLIWKCEGQFCRSKQLKDIHNQYIQCEYANKCIAKNKECTISKKKHDENICDVSCIYDGQCKVDKDLCYTTSEVDCLLSWGCYRLGLCRPVNGACYALTDEDCKNSVACELYGLCSVLNGACYAISDEDCKLSKRCKDEGLCYEDHKLCTSAHLDKSSTLNTNKIREIVAKHQEERFSDTADVNILGTNNTNLLLNDQINIKLNYFERSVTPKASKGYLNLYEFSNLSDIFIDTTLSRDSSDNQLDCMKHQKNFVDFFDQEDNFQTPYVILNTLKDLPASPYSPFFQRKESFNTKVGHQNHTVNIFNGRYYTYRLVNENYPHLYDVDRLVYNYLEEIIVNNPNINHSLKMQFGISRDKRYIYIFVYQPGAEESQFSHNLDLWGIQGTLYYNLYYQLYHNISQLDNVDKSIKSNKVWDFLSDEKLLPWFIRNTDIKTQVAQEEKAQEVKKSARFVRRDDHINYDIFMRSKEFISNNQLINDKFPEIKKIYGYLINEDMKHFSVLASVHSQERLSLNALIKYFYLQTKQSWSIANLTRKRVHLDRFIKLSNSIQGTQKLNQIDSSIFNLQAMYLSVLFVYQSELTLAGDVRKYDNKTLGEKLNFKLNDLSDDNFKRILVEYLKKLTTKKTNIETEEASKFQSKNKVKTQLNWYVNKLKEPKKRDLEFKNLSNQQIVDQYLNVSGNDRSLLVVNKDEYATRKIMNNKQYNTLGELGEDLILLLHRFPAKPHILVNSVKSKIISDEDLASMKELKKEDLITLQSAKPLKSFKINKKLYFVNYSTHYALKCLYKPTAQLQDLLVISPRQDVTFIQKK